MARALFSIARDCGHWTRISAHAPVGIEWCELCGEYRGVVVMRVRSTPKVVVPDGIDPEVVRKVVDEHGTEESFDWGLGTTDWPAPGGR